MKFTKKIFLPILKKDIRYNIINNSHFFEIIKFITNDDDEGLNEYFEWILSNIIEDQKILSKITNIEKFLILIDNRSLTIGDTLHFKGSNNSKIDILISGLKNNIINKLKEINFIQKINHNNFQIDLCIPKSLYIVNIDQIYKEIIYKIKIEEEEIDFYSLKEYEKDAIINSIPASAANDLMDFIKKSQENLENINIINSYPKINIDSVPVKIFDTTMFQFLKSIFKDDLINLYELQYHLINKIGVSYDHFMKMTANECKIFINFYNNDIKKQEEAQSQNNTYNSRHK